MRQRKQQRAQRTKPIRKAKVPTRRTGGRSARVVDDVLRATLSDLGRVGYGALRYEDIAAQSGVNKTTIYRRWPTKSQLVAAAMQHLRFAVELEDSGDLGRDLFRGFQRSLERADTALVRGVIRMFQAERDDPEVDALVRKKRADHSQSWRDRLALAAGRGELPADIDVGLLEQVLTSAVYARYLRFGEIPSAQYVEQVIGLILIGARGGGATAATHLPRS